VKFEGELVWVVNMLRYQGRSVKIVRGVERYIQSIHPCHLLSMFVNHYSDLGIDTALIRYPIDTLSLNGIPSPSPVLEEDVLILPVKTNARDEQQSEETGPSGDNGSSPKQLADSVVSAWNSVPGIVHVQRLSEKRRHAINARSRDRWWVENWEKGVAKIATLKWCREGGKWKAHIDWFLREDTLTRLLEGGHDDRLEGGAGSQSDGIDYGMDVDARDAEFKKRMETQREAGEVF